MNRAGGNAAAVLAALLWLTGCATAPSPAPQETPSPGVPPEPAPKPPAKGGYYKDDGPGSNPPANIAAIPDAVPRSEPLHRYANRPYQALGKSYVPMTSSAPFKQSGLASWYGRRFHGGLTSSGEKYDMYAMTAAHPTLPIPSYVRVTSAANGRSVVVRINDRGPFHSNRIIDLSYTAAAKLGYIDAGSARVEVEALLPGAPVSVPALTTVATTAPAAETKLEAAGGIYVQLGAFSSRDSAEDLRVRINKELSWLPDAMQVVPSGKLFKLHLGPYQSQDEARKVADRIQSELSLRPVIVGR